MAFISSSTFAGSSGANGTTVTCVVPAPATISVGNTLFVCLYSATSASSTVTWVLSGWTFTNVKNPGTGTGNMMIGIKTADASDTSAVNYSFAGSSGGSTSWFMGAAILNYTGLGSTFSTTPSSVAAAAATTCVAPSVSPAAATDLLLAFYGAFNGVAGTTVPAGMTSRASAASAGNTSIIVSDQTLSASGATGTRTQTFASSDSTVGGLVTINQAAASAVPPPLVMAQRW